MFAILWTIENTSSNKFFFVMQQLKKLSAEKLLLQKMAQKLDESVQNLIISNMINRGIFYFYQYPTIYAYNIFNWKWAVNFEVQFYSFRV